MLDSEKNTSNNDLQNGLLAGGMSFAGSTLGFFIVFLVKGIQGKPLLDWYIPTIIFMTMSIILLTTWHSGKHNPDKTKRTFIVTAIAGILSATAFIIWGIYFLP